jgi:chaperonin cofactor prefoldin
MGKSLALILHEKSMLEDELEEKGGEVTEELDRVWQDNQLELAAKVDNYAWALKHMDALIETLKERKAKATKIIQTIGNQQRRIKDRLHFYCEETGGPLRGHEYSFHPFMARSTDVIQDKVEDRYKKVAVTMTLDEWRRVSDVIATPDIKHLPVKVSDLPKDHPAIVADESPSVRMR